MNSTNDEERGSHLNPNLLMFLYLFHISYFMRILEENLPIATHDKKMHK